MRTIIFTVSLAAFYALQTSAQAPAPTKGPDPGIHPIRQIDRPDVRVLRVEIQPYAVRSVHTHDDVKFHLFIPVSGNLELTIGSAKPVEATPGQAFLMEKGTPHGFRNTGSTPGMAMEVFVKDNAATAQK
jgi:quercetin dioxygenase-like cupin family protein